MGVLDDAIREHLDLKRARGGDPAEIERMEREALGPVRREPTVGSARFEAADEHPAPEPDGGYPDDRAELLDAGYHDSTAPHPHIAHEPAFGGAAGLHMEGGHSGPFEDEPEQPKRRFLRRSRPSSLADSASEVAGFHEDPGVDPHGTLADQSPLEHHEAPGYHEQSEHHEPLEHFDPLAPPVAPAPHESLEHHESLAHHDLHEAPATPEPPAASEPATPPAASEPATPPPHLQFEHPPKRPRFSAEPPSLREQDDAEAPTGTHQSAAADAPPAAPRPGDAPGNEVEVQETTEFDVQKHIAETRFQPDPEPSQPPPAAPAAPSETPADEDVLEETPEFLQDTPEHDRLWFEQRPPRDFDFDG